MIVSRVDRLTLAAGLLMGAVGLSGCGTDQWFGGGESDPPLPGERISVLELAADIEPDPAVASLTIVLPEPRVNEDWPLPGGQANHAPGHLALGSALAEVWSAGIGTGSDSDRRLINPPILVDGRIFVADADGHVTALSAGNGDRLWRVRVASPFEDSYPLGGGVAYADGLLYVTTGFGEILAIDPANGGLVWREEANAPLRAAPTVAAGRVFIVTVDNQLEAYAAPTGEVLWNHTGILEPAGLLGGASPAVGPGAVIAAYSSGEVFALRMESGQPIWSDSLTAVRRIGALATLADIRGLPVLDNDLVFSISHAGRMVALDLRSGTRVWEQDIAGINTPWVAGDFVFVLSTTADVVALTRDTGQIRWVTPLERWTNPEDRIGPIVWSGPVLAGGRLILVNSEGVGVEISPATGDVLRAFELDGPSQVTPIVANNTLYVLTDNGRITAYR